MVIRQIKNGKGVGLGKTVIVIGTTFESGDIVEAHNFSTFAT